MELWSWERIVELREDCEVEGASKMVFESWKERLWATVGNEDQEGKSGLLIVLALQPCWRSLATASPCWRYSFTLPTNLHDIRKETKLFLMKSWFKGEKESRSGDRSTQRQRIESVTKERYSYILFNSLMLNAYLLLLHMSIWYGRRMRRKFDVWGVVWEARMRGLYEGFVWGVRCRGGNRSEGKQLAFSSREQI
jgi:hypothetical protein